MLSSDRAMLQAADGSAVLRGAALLSLSLPFPLLPKTISKSSATGSEQVSHYGLVSWPEICKNELE